MNRSDMLRLLTKTGGMAAGTAMSQLSRFRSNGKSDVTAAQARFLEDYIELRRGEHRNGPKNYAHPETSSLHTTVRRPRKDGPLTEVELMWLGRLPTDPAKVPFKDAIQLARISDSVSRMTHPDHAILVDSIWGPVKEHHDHQAALAKLAVLRATPPKFPASTAAALVDALRPELPQLTDSELLTRASAMLQDQKDRLERDHMAAIDQVRDQVAQADAAVKARGALSA